MQSYKMYVDHSLSAEALRQGRLNLGITQRELAEQLKMEAGTLSSCENGKRRFPIQRLQLLPRTVAVRVRDAMIEEFGADLDAWIEGKRSLPKGRPQSGHPRKKAGNTLAVNQAGALD